ncbi:MAG: transglutaminase family protein, partial [Pirellulaceae bacterium]
MPAYLQRIEDMAAEILAKLPSKATAPMRLEALDAYLFEENGFRGGRDEYYHPANNHLDRVIDDREGMPITLSVLYMELGRRLQLRLEGVGLPGHFVVRFRPSQGKPQLLDIF